MERLTHFDGVSYQPFGCSKVECVQKLGALEDAEEQGLLVKLPCKSGDKVYWIENGETIKSGEAWQFGYERYLWLTVKVSRTRVVTVRADSIYLSKGRAEQAIIKRRVKDRAERQVQ